ncbi:ATP-binding protein [Teredinibacter sp. KSP-S5-2]|uniref:ATP-binding protein n=1 Tax=Teredinibacter sp. KSP-S5-2 TaxID=3034506 RepID=UPI0029348FC3|nr:ATP-binding protein [Teredinibacter sp. KSP-S5-2]WNO10820.1 ATP-binding protein [Teredinibacter sp. KSP-S5-2]
MNSIRNRIILLLVIGLTCVNVVAGFYIYRYTKLEIEELFAAEQAQLARTIDRLVSTTSIPDSPDAIVSSVPEMEGIEASAYYGHDYEAKIAYQVWDLEGNLLLTSENAPLYPLAATTPGYSEIKYNDIRWHIFALYSNTANKWIYTAQQESVREELVDMLTRDHLFAMALTNLLVLTIAILAVLFGMRPLFRFSAELSERGENNLNSIDLPVIGELAPIKQAINDLLERIHCVLTQEKNFNADLAHELRTPLAAIKVHVQNIQLKETLRGESEESVHKVIRSIDNMSHTIEQLLLLNKLESEHGRMSVEEIDLYMLAKEVIMLLPDYVLAKYDFELQGEKTVILGNRTLLNTLLRNLVENAYKYSKEKELIIVRVGSENGHSMLDVIDNGPGMTDDQKLNSVRRSYRVSDTQTYGSGIGLSIVMKIVDLHQAGLAFLDKDEGEGLIARITFP